MNGDNIKDIIYLLFISTIFYFILGKTLKPIKFNKLSKINKGINFFIFILLFYFFYKVIPLMLFGNSKITEGMSLMDSISSGGKDTEGSSGSIDYTKGWDTADNFRANFCSKNPIFIDNNFFDNKDKDSGTQLGGLVYGGRSELYDSVKKEINTQFAEEATKQMKNGNKFDPTSFTKETGCLTNLKSDIGGTGSIAQMCNPKCNFKFTGKSTDTTKK